MFVLDTNVISELRKRNRASFNVLSWADSQRPESFYLSVITVMEIEYGALLVGRRDKVQGQLMRNWVDHDILPNFSGRILPIDSVVALRCARLHVPDRKPDRDVFIAATALVHDLTIVTRNTRDFSTSGVKLLDPWLA